MTTSLSKKTALITGASSGLGRALAMALARQNYNVSLMARVSGELEKTAARCSQIGAESLAVIGDVTNPNDCERFIARSIDHFDQIDLLICNAGISMWSRVDETKDLGIFKQLMETNYLGAVYCATYALPHLKKSRGTLASISSVQGKIGVPLHAGYSASKHALHGFFESLRLELEDSGVHVMMVCPTWIKGTHLRHSADKESSPDAISLDECCQQILDGLKRKSNEIFIPAKYQAVPWLKLLAPGFLKNKIKQKLTSQS